MLHLSTRAFPSPFIVCLAALTLAVLTMSSAARAQQTPRANPSAAPRSGVATPAVNQQAASGGAVTERFLSQTTARLQSADTVNNVYHYVVAFPTKTTSNFTITLQPNQSYRPSAKDLKRHSAGVNLYGVTFNKNAANHSATVKFFIPYSSLPPDVVRRLRALPSKASTRDAPKASPQLVSYQYRPVGYQGGGQQSAPVSGGAEELGVLTTLFNQMVESGAVDPQVADWIAEAFPENPEAGENAIEAYSALKDINEALTLNQEDSEILAEVMALENCARNMPNGLPNMPEFQAEIDQLGSEAREDVEMQFLALMAKVTGGLLPAPQSTGMGILQGGPIDAVANGFAAIAKQELEADLKTLRSEVPSCVADSWWGDFEMTNTIFGEKGVVVSTTSESGTMNFTVTAGAIKGTVDGMFKTRYFFGWCIAEDAFTGQLSGRTAMQSPEVPSAFQPDPSENMAIAEATLSPSHISVSGIISPGTPAAQPCPQAQGPLKGFAIKMSLIDGKPYSKCFLVTPLGTASCGNKLVEVRSKTENTVTVHKALP
jgi:hypothetical protein